MDKKVFEDNEPVQAITKIKIASRLGAVLPIPLISLEGKLKRGDEAMIRFFEDQNNKYLIFVFPKSEKLEGRK